MDTRGAANRERARLLASRKYGGICECGIHAWTRLSQGYVAIVSAKNAEIIKRQAYFALVRKAVKTVYAIRTVEGERIRRSAYLHRDIFGGEENVDHWNGNGLDNQEPNLRPASNSENGGNMRRPKTNTTGYKGVSRRRGRFRAVIKKDQRFIEIGAFDLAEDAARAYDARARELFGPFARLNFPDHP